MKLISHRGNICGRVPARENRPSYIDCALQLGYDVEIDIRYCKGEFWLGHDTPDYKIPEIWINTRKHMLWFHCKDIFSAIRLKDMKVNYFCHTADPYVPVSSGHFWVHDLSLPIDTNCIIPLLGKLDISNYNNSWHHAICTYYIMLAKEKFKK